MTSTRDRLEAILASLAAGDQPHVFLKLYGEAARAAADAADRRRRAGIPLGHLDGTIVSIKDLFDVAGEPTTAGSALLGTAPPATADAVIVKRLRQAGAVIIGKTNMSELAFDALGRNPHFGAPANAVDSARMAGGSSSGAAVSVARQSADIAIGSDTGGSVRIPASLNGVVGFKPTAGRVPTTGAHPLSFTLDSIGPLARSVAECAAADAVMAAEDVRLPAVPLAGLSIGLPRGQLLEGLEPMVGEAFERCLQRLGQCGVGFVDVDIDDLIGAMREATAHGSIASFEGAALNAHLLETPAMVAAMNPTVSGPFLRRLGAPAHVYIRMMQRRGELAGAMNERLLIVDALALPTTPMTAPLAAPLAADAELADRTELRLLRNTQVANQFGLTGISLPMPGMERPAGLMLLARGGEDRRLLAIAASVEAALGRS
jgi:aspartyl-tRNA(Asn)/glutamyl-tRNA(Gln) amidotransferase subunit A